MNVNEKKALKWLPLRQLGSGEKIIFFLRRHWFVLFTKYLFMLILSLIPIVVTFLLGMVFPAFTESEAVRTLAILLGSVYYLFIWITLFTIFIDYYLDIWIVTNHRIIDIEQKGLFHHVVSEQSLEQVQDVSSNVQGVIPTLLDYGTVLIQTAAHTNLFHFKQISEPAVVARKVNELAAQYRRLHN